MNQKRCKYLRRVALFCCTTQLTQYNDDRPARRPRRTLGQRIANALGLLSPGRSPRVTRRLLPTCFRGKYQQFKKEALDGRT